VDALLSEPLTPLADLESFSGAGIYALYYLGAFPAYQKLAKASGPKAHPIYVGKAVPSGARKGGLVGKNFKTNALYARIRQHQETIQSVDSLEIEEFRYRCLTVDDIWIPLAETLLIQRYRPVWNLVVEGFGNHDPGAGRYGGQRPLWDELHPGRAWASRCASAKLSASTILNLVSQHLKSDPAHQRKKKG